MDAWQSWRGPLLYAHRGARLERPENTPQALATAVGLGADALEIDVHMTRDGQVVVAHDADGLRMAGDPRAIRDCTLAEVQSWDVSRGFEGQPLQVARVPTLADVLEELPGVPLNIDLKQSQPSMVEAALGVVQRAAAYERVLLTSFSFATLRAVRAAGYPGPTGFSQAEAVLLVFAPPRLLRRLALAGSRLQIPTRHGPLRLDRPALIDKMHALGIAVDYWVINDIAQAERLLDRGADGIVTDDPRAMAGLFERHGRCDGWRARRPRGAGP
ncbi:MAG: glycerophosphodiester phosphodiesterase family protein [Myxococcales bacterium]|nr:glycerophosphodiester phosphodiesterase family protein [Myxococcales bacterium]